MSRSFAKDMPVRQLDMRHDRRSCQNESFIHRRNLKLMKKLHGVNQAYTLHISAVVSDFGSTVALG
jgi:hypothetical protein